MSEVHKVPAWLHIGDNSVSIHTEEGSQCSFPCEIWAEVEDSGCGGGDFAIKDIWINSEISEKSTKLNHYLAFQASQILQKDKDWLAWAEDAIGYVDPGYEKIGIHETIGSRRTA